MPADPISGYVSADGSGTCCLLAPVYLPDGAEVSALSLEAYDNDAGADFSLSLYRKSLADTGLGTAMALVATSGNSPTLRTFSDITIINPIIDNLDYVYWLANVACLSGSFNRRIYAAKIFFSE